MNVPDIIEGRAIEQPHPPGARQLGVRVKPIIRLGMGHKDERGYPVKDDHFTVRGDDQAIRKFHSKLGDKPKSVPILLPSTLDQALTIQYRAFKGASDEEGGILTAIGQTNFALRDYVGGPDIVTHFDQDGTVEDLETAGLDANSREPLDETAAKLGIELYTTLRAGMPDVLGFGSFFEITTKGKASTDALWAKLRELYGLFGSRVTFAVQPLLVMRPGTARPVVEKDGKPKRIKTQIFVLDVVVPESIDEMIGRLARRTENLGTSSLDAVYGRPALPTGVPPDGVAPDGAEARQAAAAASGTTLDGGVAQQAASETDEPKGSAPVSEAVPVRAPEPEPEPTVAEEPVKKPNLNQAATTVIPFGRYEGQTLKELHKNAGEDGRKYIAYLIHAAWDVPGAVGAGLSPRKVEALRLAASVYAERQLPEALKPQEPQA
jgi:Recombination directionality factor-like